MYAATANGVMPALAREEPRMTAINPNVATNSPASWPNPERTCREAENSGASNIRCASATPANAPSSWAAT